MFHKTTATILVDHGSRRAESNALLTAVAERFANQSGCRIVEPAHMELAEPSIATAFARCVERGAERVIVFPFFLGPGRHWSEDIPRLTSEAAAAHPGVSYLVTAPLGNHPLMATIMLDRIEHCSAHAEGQRPRCDVCSDETECQLQNQSSPRGPDARI